ncbi:phospholipase A2-like isoform X2 [Chrysoperla carnea]|nr:phospholipase A2-like isoform X2 [Chrysoperla carnea]XP_044737878.1 phospholipase A2-like isoform X2 [Chrysoperla carnea]
MTIQLYFLILLLCITITQCTVLVADLTMSRMIELNAKPPFCTFHSERGTIQRMLLASDQRRVRQMSNNAISLLEEICRNNKVTSMHQGGFIYPGTKWCGPGDVAKNYTDLGYNKAEDVCCREHDHCPNIIKSGECKNGICNTSHFTRSHCDCDARFRRCLQSLNTEVANTLGAVFFNVVQVTCFKERRPCSQWQRSKNQCAYEFRQSPKYPNQKVMPPVYRQNDDGHFLEKVFTGVLYKVLQFFPGGRLRKN